MIPRNRARVPAIGLIAAGLFQTALCSHAEAQSIPAVPVSSTDLDEVPIADAEPVRPRFEMAIGMGVSFDNTGLSDGRTVAVPSFQVQAGLGSGRLGFELRLFSSAADGRYHDMSKANGVSDMAVDRLAVDLMLAWRPVFNSTRENPRWVARVLRSATIDVGLAVENASQSQKTIRRQGGVVGAHIDVPLTPVTGPSELRLRLVARRMVASSGTIGSVAVSDSRAEVFAALVFVF